MSDFEVTLSGSSYKLAISSQSNLAGEINIRNTRNNYVPTAKFKLYDVEKSYYNKIDINDTLYINVNNYNIFTGEITSKQFSWLGSPVIDISAIGRVSKLFSDKVSPNETFKNKYSQDIANSLMDDYYPEYYISSSTGDINFKNITFNRWSVGDALSYMSKAEDYVFYFAPSDYKTTSDKTAHYFSSAAWDTWDSSSNALSGMAYDTGKKELVLVEDGSTPVYFSFGKRYNNPSVAWRIKSKFYYYWDSSGVHPSSQFLIRFYDSAGSKLEDEELTKKYKANEYPSGQWIKKNLVFTDSDLSSDIEDVYGVDIVYSGAQA